MLNHVVEAPGLREWFEAATEVGNPDALLLALKVREKISIDSSTFGKLLPNSFSSSQLFSADHLSSLSNCLKVAYIHSYLCVANIFLDERVMVERNVSCAFSECGRNLPSVSLVFIVYGLF